MFDDFHASIHAQAFGMQRRIFSVATGAILLLAFVVLPGCRHTLKPRWNEAAKVSLAPELVRIGAVEVDQVPTEFFRGFTLATVPSLSPSFKNDIADVVRAAIRGSGGTTDIAGAPAFRVSFEECSMDWRVTGVITSVMQVKVRGTLSEPEGDGVIYRGESTDSYSAFSADVSVNSERQFNKAMQQAIAQMLSDRSATNNGTGYEAELRAFRRSLRDVGGTLGMPGYGVGLALSLGVQATTIAFPSPNAAAAGLLPGDVIVAYGGVSAGTSLTLQRAAEIERTQLDLKKPLQIEIERNGTPRMIAVPLSNDNWRERWLAAVEREDWREALRIFDLATQGSDTCVTTLQALQLRRSMILLLDLRADGNTGFDTLYSSVAVLQEIFDRARFDPQTVRLNRTLILQTIDLSRALGSASVAEDLQRRLAEFDSSQSSSSVGPTDRDPPRTAAAQSVAGTGFMVSPDGAILTALHVVEGASEIEAIDGDGTIHRARLVGTLPDLDIALLEVELKNAPTLVVPSSLRAVSGDAVFTIGFPATDLLGTEPKFSDGAISSLSGLKGDLSRMQVSVPIQPGNSGGPLVNERGEAIGVVVSSAAAASFYRNTGALPQNVNFAVRTDLARSLLAGRAKSTLPPCESLQEAIERTRRALYRIQAR